MESFFGDEESTSNSDYARKNILLDATHLTHMLCRGLFSIKQKYYLWGIAFGDTFGKLGSHN